ncbi:MAG: hypothetical protein M0Q22_12055 [Sulfuritalea sp.]|jgi:hypothetical protein|nr:hypothetical protein [Sulfuritalea sp.]
MIEFPCQYIQQIINSIGLAFDIAGAIFVAHEVVAEFHGEKYEAGIGSGPIGGIPTNDPPVETGDFKRFEAARLLRMKIGLGCLIVGFCFQFASNWIKAPSEAKSSQQTSQCSSSN